MDTKLIVFWSAYSFLLVFLGIAFYNSKVGLVGMLLSLIAMVVVGIIEFYSAREFKKLRKEIKEVDRIVSKHSELKWK